MMCGYPVDMFDIGLPLILIMLLFLLVIFRARKIHMRYEELYKQGFENQKEIISLLKEIRDSVRK